MQRRWRPGARQRPRPGRRRRPLRRGLRPRRPRRSAYFCTVPNYEPARRCGFLVNNAAICLWWKGGGSGIDFFNPRAMAWWHRQQDLVLDMGIDGWKLDFGESYITTETVITAAGKVPHQKYSDSSLALFSSRKREQTADRKE